MGTDIHGHLRKGFLADPTPELDQFPSIHNQHISTDSLTFSCLPLWQMMI